MNNFWDFVLQMDRQSQFQGTLLLMRIFNYIWHKTKTSLEIWVIFRNMGNQEKLHAVKEYISLKVLRCQCNK